MHQSVLYHEIINALLPHSEGKYVDCTVGAGGHAWGILEASAPGGLLLGLDLDADALSLAAERLSAFRDRFTLVQASYITLSIQLAATGWTGVDGILLDLGVSSMQLDQKDRGFSYRHEAPLDMRFNPLDSTQPTAADLVNTLSESDLADLIFRYGEDRQSRQIARRIVQNRPIATTTQLAGIVSRGSSEHRVHPATRVFQALRIAVNQELASVEKILPIALDALNPGGRLAVISFHSLEDRLVKTFFRRESKDCLCPPTQPICSCGHSATITDLTRKPVQPVEAEIRQNPRARSARLRVVEKK